MDHHAFPFFFLGASSLVHDASCHSSGTLMDHHAFPFFFLGASSLVFVCDIFSAKTCFTHFCSSIKKALTTRVRTQAAQREPPYARFTRRSRFLRRRYSMGRKRGNPIRALPQSPQCGPFAFFFRTWTVSLPPGVRNVLCLFDLVL